MKCSLVPAAAAVLVLAACSNGPMSDERSADGSDGEVTEPPVVPVEVTSELTDPEGSRLGTATFTDTATGVEVELDASGLTTGAHPVGLYGVGICEPASASAADPGLIGDFFSAGDLIVFTEDPGDLPSLVVGEEEVGRLTSLVSTSNLDELLDEDGTALIIHAAVDPAAPADGPLRSRVACAEISG
ncbi:superoxide dismutase, Cu-Zn family [Modestobacter sp. DSM 44400]|uniref:superoxide dismutase family protein n=1 Tax=Modestobacter sp. DSM 44400 TaxID=1550230 RepID=UPI00089856F4|nr:superoxide dismutase family protein [Modestobacter sp. DSM 44400]SDY28161.1 superoxide dismutase, Cu-Zn family [Modestobacter sp. DSM 44400]